MRNQKSPKNSHCETCPSLGEGIFCDLKKNSLDEVSEHKISNKFKKGQTLFVQGNPPFGLYCISEGNIKVTKVDSNGKETIVRIASRGDVLGHRSIFANNNNYSATATAIEDTTVCFLDKKFILKFVENEPTVALNLISQLSLDMGAAEEKIASNHQKSVRERLAELLLLLGQSHGVEEENKIKIDLKLSREEMASLTGTATETVIRFLSEFKEDGYIEQIGKTIYIIDEDQLLELANPNY